MGGTHRKLLTVPEFTTYNTLNMTFFVELRYVPKQSASLAAPGGDILPSGQFVHCTTELHVPVKY